MDSMDMYKEALAGLEEKKQDYEEKGILTYAYTQGIALFLLAISPNGVIHVTEFTPWRIKANIRPEVSPEGVKLKFSLPEIKGNAKDIPSVINYLQAVYEAVLNLQSVIDLEVNDKRKEIEDAKIGKSEAF